MSGAQQGKGAKPARSNLQLRIMSALVLGALVLIVTYFGGVAFRILSAAIAAAIFYEWTAMRQNRVPPVHLAIAVILLAVILLVMVLGQAATTVILLLFGGLVLLAAHGLVSGAGLASTAGLAYAAGPALALAYLRGGDAAGLLAILFLFAVVWTTDTMAYFTGRAIGGAKLAPSISPGKTWSGAIGGALFALLAGVAFAFHDKAVYSALIVGGVALLLAVVSEVGDLFESALKRRQGVKDSSNLIPGHGGVMDRVDGLMVAALVFYVIAALIAGPDTPARAFFRF